MENDDLLPALPTHLPLIHCTTKTEEEQLQANELNMVSYIFTQVAEAWNQATDIDSICKATALTFKTMEKRRDVLGMPNGYRPERHGGKGLFVYPLD